MNRKVMLPISLCDREIGFYFLLSLFLLSLIFAPIGSAEANGNPEVYEVNFMLNQGPNDLIWGVASPGTTVTVERNSLQLFTAYADPVCSGCWEADMPYEFTSGDEVTITGSPGLHPVTVTIPDPLDTYVDTNSDRVWGQIGDYPSNYIEVFGEWEGGYQETTTDTEGKFSVDYTSIAIDIPYGGSGQIFFAKEEELAPINFHMRFRSLDLLLEVNYLHDWVQGYYEPDHAVSITIYESDSETVKASVEVTSAPMQGTNQTGFSTIETTWLPTQPDIIPGDWVYAYCNSSAHQTWVQVGSLTGEIDICSDSITGTVWGSWLMPGPIEVECSILGEEEPESQHDSVDPDGEDFYTCTWDAWDIYFGDTVQVAYKDDMGHKIINNFFVPFNIHLPLIMR